MRVILALFVIVVLSNVVMAFADSCDPYLEPCGPYHGTKVDTNSQGLLGSGL